MKPRIVCNTGPLIALSLIDCQHVFNQLYDPLIPRKVIEEWAAAGKTGIPERSLRIAKS